MAADAYDQDAFGIGPFLREDLSEAAALWSHAFGLDSGDAEVLRGSSQRLAFGIETDPGGSFVAQRDGVLLGVAQALRRDELWVLSSLAVAREARGEGIGRTLLQRALGYGGGLRKRLIVSSDDPSATSLYAAAGLRVRPTLQAFGDAAGVRRIAPRERYREAGLADLRELEPISRHVRGATHTREIEFALARGDARVLVGDGGFVVAREGHGVWLLAAYEQQQAADLLLAGLSLARHWERAPVRWIPEDQAWAIEVCETAGLTLSRWGALCVAGDPGPLQPFIPSGPFA